MEITKYSDLKKENMPIEVYTARASFQSTNYIKTKQYSIKGSYKKETVVGFKKNKHVGTSFSTGENKLFNNIFIYHGNNPNKIFTTEEEAIEWSKKDLGYI